MLRLEPVLPPGPGPSAVARRPPSTTRAGTTRSRWAGAACASVMLRLTATWQLAILPADPVYCRLHADRVLPLLEKARVVDDPGHHGLPLLQRGDGVPRRREANLVVVPRRVRDEVVDPLVARARVLRVARRPRCNRFHALALRLAQQTHRVHRERRASVAAAEQLADAVEVPLKPALAFGIHLVRHASVASRRGPARRADSYMITYDHVWYVGPRTGGPPIPTQ